LQVIQPRVSRARQSLVRSNRNWPSLRRTGSVSGLAVICALATGGLASSVAYAQGAIAAASPSEAAEVPKLARVITLAEEHAPEVAIGRSSLQASRSSLVGAGLWPVQNPYLEVLATRTDRGLSRGTIVAGTLWLPFEVAGQRGRRIAEANSYVTMHAVDVERAKSSARAAALRAWGRAIVEAERIRTLTEIASAAEAEAKAFQVRRDVGDATERDAQLAEVEHARHVMLVEEARAALDAALGELTRITATLWKYPTETKVHPDIPIERLRPEIAAAQSPLVKMARTEADYHGQVDARLAREAIAPVSLVLTGGHGGAGEALYGAGIGWTLPTFRRFQGERAEAQAERERALTRSSITRHDIAKRLTTIVSEMKGIRRALDVLDGQALPAALAARLAAEQMFRSGKTDILSVLVSRRDEANLRLRHLDLAEHEWALLADWAELTSELP
jgi:cobalt-zinc-cadmium efflux system outer membrane protein